MITHFPFEELGNHNYGWLNARYHFNFANYYNPNLLPKKPLLVWNDDLIQPNSGFPMHSHHNMEIITYIRKGKISHKDNLGNNGEIKEGQVQVMSAGSGITHSEYNLSSEETLLFQIWIEPNKNNIKPTWKNINLANNNKAIEILASGELKYEQSDTLKIQQDASVIRIVGEKDIIKYKLHKNRHYYGVVSEGLVNINNMNKINSRDGFYIQSEDQIDFNFLKSSEIILVDMPKII